MGGAWDIYVYVNAGLAIEAGDYGWEGGLMVCLGDEDTFRRKIYARLSS